MFSGKGSLTKKKENNNELPVSMTASPRTSEIEESNNHNVAVQTFAKTRSEWVVYNYHVGINHINWAVSCILSRSKDSHTIRYLTRRYHRLLCDRSATVRSQRRLSDSRFCVFVHTPHSECNITHDFTTTTTCILVCIIIHWS